MGLLAKYDPKNVTITFGSLVLNEGIAAGTFVEITREERNSDINIGSDGGGTVVINHNRKTTATVTLRNGSNANTKMSEIVLQDEADNDIKVIETFMVKDFNGDTQVDGPECFIDGPPDVSFGDEEGDTVWNIMGLSMAIFAGSSNEAKPVVSAAG